MSYTALILAGGQARRMGGVDKGLVKLAGRPLIAHTLQALAQQSQPPQHILISANRHLDEYAAYGHAVLPDSLPDYPGPLAGLLAGMQAAPDATLLLLPCDALVLPVDFAARLLAALPGQQVVSASDPAQWHPSLLALQAGLQPSLLDYLQQGSRSIRGWLAGLQHDTVPFAQPFANLNTLDDVRQLERQWPAG
ncbi:molybdenum cofactor guanylyltransferase MobA [Aquitalea magnusonii]|uniref:Molybdenum cofactor guanylyltransferase n=1 Tax=Aquitalea magnusonii TaxID=332411 RepID=A0A318JGD3_9NEIS|nr:molybdenum cofactor guanylyltransferase MobA [Aquitalea magnusonii]PXX46173.1 molybdopterin-guanine dinucleotide biosynthesis protein A [Aquitalea magnusonii]